MTILDPLTIKWNRQNSQAKMKAEHGSRFSHVSNNAATFLKWFNEIVLFAEENGHSVKMQTFSNLVRKQREIIKNELTALASCWFLVLSPLWIKLRKSNATTSLNLIDTFTTFSENLQEASDKPTSLQVADPEINKIMNLDDTDRQFEPSSHDLVTMITIEHEKTQLNESIKRMLKEASAYMTKLSKNWIRADVPDESIKFPFSNQVQSFNLILCDLGYLIKIVINIFIQRVESFFAFVDRTVLNCSGAHMRNRLEIARAKMNHLYEFILALPLEDRLTMITDAYANASSNKDKVRSEERKELEYHRIYDETRRIMVNIFIFNKK